MTKTLTLYAVLAFALRASGQTTYTDHPNGDSSLVPTVQSPLANTLLGVVIERWRYDPAAKTVILHLVNNSHKDVTAFNISIAERYADGSTDYVDGTPNDIHDHQVMEDKVNLYLMDGRSGKFLAGTTLDYLIPEAKDIADVEAILDVVAYADGTADVQNDRAFRNLMAARKGPLLAMQKVDEIIKRVLADPMVSSPVAEVLRALRPLADANQKNRPPEDPEYFEAMNLRNEVNNLEMMRSHSNERERLMQYVEQQEKRIALMKPHCELVTKTKKAPLPD